ncbi:phosphoenolpyruvate--protein phosphotransferase [Acetobacteraceae bacterium KSS8]|uniref:Phosphoenolpyruvate-protein phosphotransferase n=1 Tax=Endosaccharibacter trunci TaxID=2812733 RepID=A0ABT1W6H0_9PROT|nr:phosphoenolpyruvate--protein phosphotransferase [Acetobacteraceae bacterium KSS8]
MTSRPRRTGPKDTKTPPRTPASRGASPKRGRQDTAPPEEAHFSGVGVYAGIAVGPVAFADEAPTTVDQRRLEADAVEPELKRLDDAVERSQRQLEKLKNRLALLSEDSQAEIAPLLDAYRQMLGPSRLLRQVRRRIEEDRLNAAAAVLSESETLATRLADVTLAGSVDAEEATNALRRAEEVREIGRRLVRNLMRAPFRSFASVPAGAILVAEQLRPADAALIDPARTAGVVMDEGGTADHTAIMLRALGIPAVLGVSGFTARARSGARVVVDGSTGSVILDPAPETLEMAERAVVDYARERQKLGRLRRLPARLSGGEGVELQANLELPAELPLIPQAGAAGIGLLRTEFLFINAAQMPSEGEQEAIYRAVIAAMGGDCTTIRVLDWGGEKHSDALSGIGVLGADINPALGERGLRLLLRHPELFETQLAAILRASVEGPVRVLLPMVTTVDEMKEARQIYERVARRVRRRGVKLGDTLPPLGIMVETPAAALGAEVLALEAEFMAIGTNDLTMYTLAVDRAAAGVSKLYDPLHPAVLKMIGQVTDAALRLRRPVSLCGEIAGDPLVVPLLIGMGLRSFSMNAQAVPRVKQVVRHATLDECRRLARRVMEESDPKRIAELLRAFAGR